MKKVTIAVALALALTMLVTGVVYAGSAKSNARADFEPYLINSDYVSADAGGHAIINYVKDAEVWEVNGKVQNLNPDTQYTLQIGRLLEPTPRFNVGTFITDSKGKANFHYRVVLTDGLEEHYGIVRIIYVDVDSDDWQNPGVGGTIVMLARQSGTCGTLEFRGTWRGN